MIKKHFIFNWIFVFIPLTLLSNFSYAGSWISSGGDFLKDASNPWFIRNTKSISYCIEVDEKTVSAAKSDIEDLVTKAFDYWKKEFAPFNQYNFMVALGTQSLDLQDCNGSEDVRFQIGSGTLSEVQKNYFKHNRVSYPQIIGQTTRTDYNLVTLQGRGFVYLASDRGNTSYDTGGRLIEHAWQNKGLMYRVLVHEIGHIFGLPHLGSGIMAESYMEEILDKRFYKDYADSFELGSFFQGPVETASCKINSAAQKFFKLNSNSKCLFVSSGIDAEHLNISSGASTDSKRELIGSIEYEKPKLGEGNSSFETQPGVRLWLPPEQQVFDKKSVDKSGRSLSGPMFFLMNRSATLVMSSDNSIQKVLVTTAPGKQQIIAQDINGIRVMYSAVTGKRAYAE